MTIVDEAIALIKQWQKNETLVEYVTRGSGPVNSGRAKVTLYAGFVNLVGFMAFLVDESSVQSVRTGVITLKSDGGVVELFVLD